MLPDAIYKPPGLAFDASFVLVVEVETVGFDCTALEFDAGGAPPFQKISMPDCAPPAMRPLKST